MDFKKIGIKYGVIVGLLTVATYMLTYTLDKTAYFGPGVSIVAWVIYLAGMWKASVDTLAAYRLYHEDTEEEVSYSFTQALQAPFLVFLLAQALYYIHFWFLFNVLDSSMVDVAREYALNTLESTTELFSKFLDDATIDQMTDAIESQDFRVTFRSSFFNFSRSLIGGFILSSIYALIYKKSVI